MRGRQHRPAEPCSCRAGARHVARPSPAPPMRTMGCCSPCRPPLTPVPLWMARGSLPDARGGRTGRKRRGLGANTQPPRPPLGPTPVMVSGQQSGCEWANRSAWRQKGSVPAALIKERLPRLCVLQHPSRSWQQRAAVQSEGITCSTNPRRRGLSSASWLAVPVARRQAG